MVVSHYTIQQLGRGSDLPCMSCDRVRPYAYCAEFIVIPAPNGAGTEWMCGRCFEEWREIPALTEIPMTKVTARVPFSFVTGGQC